MAGEVEAETYLETLLSMAGGRWDVSNIRSAEIPGQVCAAAQFSGPQGDGVGYGFMVLVGVKDEDDTLGAPRALCICISG